MCMHTNTHTCMQKAFRNFHLFKRAEKINKLVAWLAVGDGWSSMGGWAVWETDVSSLGLGQVFLFTTKSTSQWKAISVPSIGHPSIPQKGYWVCLLMPRAERRHPSSLGTYDLVSHFIHAVFLKMIHFMAWIWNAFLLFWFCTFHHQTSLNSSVAIYIHIFSKIFIFLAWEFFWSW